MTATTKTIVPAIAVLLFIVLGYSSCTGPFMKMLFKDKHFPPDFATHEHVLIIEWFGEKKPLDDIKECAAELYGFPHVFATSNNINEDFPDREKYRYTLGTLSSANSEGNSIWYIIVFDRKHQKGYRSPTATSTRFKQVYKAYFKEMRERMIAGGFTPENRSENE